MTTHSTNTCILIFFLLISALITHGTCEPTISPNGPPPYPFCPMVDTLKLGVCAEVLGLVNVVVGSPESSKCCALLEGLVNLEVAACLCTAIKANVLGINLNVPISLSLLVGACGKTIPPGFKCE